MRWWYLPSGTSSVISTLGAFSRYCVLVVYAAVVHRNFPFGLQAMLKPSFVFDGRNILPHKALSQIGFEVHKIGSPGPLQS